MPGLLKINKFIFLLFYFYYCAKDDKAQVWQRLGKPLAS